MTGNKGFTLVELLVAVTIFTVVIGSGSGIFVSALRAQQEAFSEQNAVESTRFAIEYMSRQIRLAQRDTAGTCTGVADTFYAIAGGGTQLALINSQSQCVVFALAGDEITARIDGGAAVPITSASNVSVSRLLFIIAGEERTDALQPRVTISISADTETIQTTVSTRSLDV